MANTVKKDDNNSAPQMSHFLRTMMKHDPMKRDEILFNMALAWPDYKYRAMVVGSAACPVLIGGYSTHAITAWNAKQFQLSPKSVLNVRRAYLLISTGMQITANSYFVGYPAYSVDKDPCAACLLIRQSLILAVCSGLMPTFFMTNRSLAMKSRQLTRDMQVMAHLKSVPKQYTLMNVLKAFRMNLALLLRQRTLAMLAAAQFVVASISVELSLRMRDQMHETLERDDRLFDELHEQATQLGVGDKLVELIEHKLKG